MNIIQVEEFYIIGIAVRTSNSDLTKLGNDMQSLWNNFMTNGVMAKISNRIDDDIYCVYTDYEGDYTKPYTALLGCKVPNLGQIPDKLIGRQFCGGKYAKTLAKGNLFAGIVYDAWQKIWESDLQRSYIADFEIYGAKSASPENAEVEILVGVK